MQLTPVQQVAGGIAVAAAGGAATMAIGHGIAWANEHANNGFQYIFGGGAALVTGAVALGAAQKVGGAMLGRSAENYTLGRLGLGFGGWAVGVGAALGAAYLTHEALS